MELATSKVALVKTGLCFNSLKVKKKVQIFMVAKNVFGSTQSHFTVRHSVRDKLAQYCHFSKPNTPFWQVLNAPQW